MPTKKIRVELSNNGDRYTIIFEGNITKDKTLRLLDLVELLGGMPIQNPSQVQIGSQISKIDKVRLTVEKNFPLGWFSSTDLKFEYEKQFNESLSLSTISTYLSRLANRGYLNKKRISNKLRYRIITSVSNYEIRKK